MSNYPKNRKCKHGLAKKGQVAPEYWVWAHMLQRCENPKDAEYKNYGARGILVCESWHDFSSFYSDMGSRPTSKHEIERLNNDGNYEPSNCCWATRKEQTRNNRRTHWVEHKGQRWPITDLSDHLFSDRSTISKRLYKGWTLERALNTPLDSAGNGWANRRQAASPT